MVGNGRPTPPHRRDQPATIDLAATEVRVEPVDADAAQAGPANAPEASANASGEVGAGARAAAPPPAAAPIGSWRARGALIAAADAGAAAVGVLGGALALAGLVQI